MSQQQVADALGVSRQTVWNFENSGLKKIRKALGIPEPRRSKRCKP